MRRPVGYRGRLAKNVANNSAERVHLLAHILRLVVEPNAKQHGDIQKLALNVKKLEETTNEALSAFFMDNETNAKKRPYLNEIFKMARQEERFKNGEIGTAAPFKNVARRGLDAD